MNYLFNWYYLWSNEAYWQFGVMICVGLLAGLCLGRILVSWHYFQRSQSRLGINRRNPNERCKRSGAHRYGRLAALQLVMPRFLRALAATLQAGMPATQALLYVGEEIDEPLKSALEPGLKALRQGDDLSVAAQMWQTIPVREFKFLTQSLVVQMHNGGDLGALCKKIAEMIETRLKLEQDLKTFTAQGKMSGWVMAALWPISLLLFAWLAPQHTDILWSSTAGHWLLIISAVLEGVGFWFIWHLTRIRL